MTTGNDPKELSDLEPLEDLEDVPELDADLEEVPELDSAAPAPAPEPLEELPAGSEPAAAPAGAAAGAPRELEKAPLMLKKAALVLIVAALFPWLIPGGWDVARILSKAVILLGGYFLYLEVLHLAGEKIPGAFSSIAKMHAKALGALGLVLMLVGALPLIDPGFKPVVEKAAVAVGLLTWCQVLSYEKGGKFNPVWSLVIPVFGLAALGRLAFLAAEFDVFALIGALGVAGAGGFAGYTMFLAMKEAKEHGKQKKRAQMEERKRQRRSKTKR